MRITNWQTGFLCIKCNEELSNLQRLHSHGRCPYCGYKDEYACTIVATKEFAYRFTIYWDFTFPFRHKIIERIIS